MDTLEERGWFEKDNGELLDLAEREGYEVLVTTEQSLRYQQNMEDRHIGIVVLLSANWPDIRRRALEVGRTITEVRRGKVAEVPIRTE